MKNCYLPFALLVAVVGICLGVADIAMAGPGNSNGCKTTLYIPIVGSAGIWCGETSCQGDCSSVELLDDPGIWICTCSDNPADSTAAFITGLVCVTAVEMIAPGRLALKCYPSLCATPPCLEDDKDVSEGEPSVVVGNERWCECP